MHESSYNKVEAFVKQYLEPFYQDKEVAILDIGSYDVNGTYKPLFNRKTWNYTGLDIRAGKNVDIVVKNLYHWNNVRSNTFDVVISGQAFEHIEYFWVTMLEIARVLKSGGLCCIIAPSSGMEHKYPVDCWRFYPDGFRTLAQYARLDIMEVHTEFEPVTYQDGSEIWKDSVLIAKKPSMSVWGNVLFSIKCYASKIMTRL